MAAGPPKRLESFVGLLIPPACREEVLGDLCERFRTPAQFFADGLRAALAVNFSRIRRTTNPQVMLMEAMTLYLSFLSAAWFLDGKLLNDRWGLLRLAVPPAIALVVLRFCDAWALPESAPAFRAVRGVAAAAGIAFLCQIEALPAFVNLLGAGLSLLLVSAVRVVFLPGKDLPQGAGAPGMRIRTTALPLQVLPASRMRDTGLTILLLIFMGLALRYGGRGLMVATALSGLVYWINKSR
ncbi:MAG TPA: hypothetical protein VG273_02915 [Bryobacteraceae bacterium]|jgi:hypothetical protein|nr:hypothetical protein [Bryobacteraceae bacterium]